MRNSKEKISLDTRQAVFERDNWTCRACGEYDPTGDALQADHIKPESLGGQATIGNLQTLCGVCNNRKQNIVVKLPKRDAPQLGMTLADYKRQVSENRALFHNALKRKRIKARRAG